MEPAARARGENGRERDLCAVGHSGSTTRVEELPTVAHVAHRMLEVLWAGAGKASRLRALLKNGRYHGARIIDLEPSEYFGVDPLSILWTSATKAERLMKPGRLDATRALDGAA